MSSVFGTLNNVLAIFASLLCYEFVVRLCLFANL